MASTSLKRSWWHEYRCVRGPEVQQGFFGRSPVFAANNKVVEAVRALEQGHLGSGYVPTSGGWIGSMRYCPAGIGGKRCEPSGKNCSLHNYGPIAWDIEYNYNGHVTPYTRVTAEEIFYGEYANMHKYTEAQVEAIENIRTLDGKRLFRWLGWIRDFMHWEIDVKPEEVSVDWTTVPDGVPPEPPPEKEEVVWMLPVLRKGDGLVSRTFGDRTHLQEEVAALQAGLRVKGFIDDNTHDQICGIDGRFWDGTERALKSFQASVGITVDGVAGEQTYTHLFREGTPA